VSRNGWVAGFKQGWGCAIRVGIIGLGARGGYMHSQGVLDWLRQVTCTGRRSDKRPKIIYAQRFCLLNRYCSGTYFSYWAY